jgi:hypothetical protein
VFDELEHITRSCGLRWSVQDSALQLRDGLPVGDRQGPLFRKDSGLIGERGGRDQVVEGAESVKGLVKANKTLKAARASIGPAR